MSDFVRDLFQRKREQAARELEEARRVALESGKEPFDIIRLEVLMGAPPGTFASREADLCETYYVSHPEIRTLAEFAEFRNMLSQWE